MFSISAYRAPSRKQLRSFGLILGICFFVIGLWPVVFRNTGPRRWAVALTLILVAAGLFVPGSLRQVHWVWTLIGNILGRINSTIILGLLYFLVVTPTRLFLTLAGRDPMNRKFDAKSETYRVDRSPRPASHMNRQF